VEANRRISKRLGKQLKVDVEDLQVLVQRKGKELTIRARWVARARWPLTRKVSNLRFVREVRTRLE